MKVNVNIFVLGGTAKEIFFWSELADGEREFGCGKARKWDGERVKRVYIFFLSDSGKGKE